MSKTLKRYEPDVRYVGTGNYIPVMTANPDGEWIEYADHERIVAELRDRAEKAEGRAAAAEHNMNLVVEAKPHLARENYELRAEIERLRDLAADMMGLLEEMPVKHPQQEVRRDTLRICCCANGIHQQLTPEKSNG